MARQGPSINIDGKKVKERRVSLGLTQQELAKKAGWHSDTIRRAESSRKIRFEIARSIAGALGLSVNDIIVKSTLKKAAAFFLISLIGAGAAFAMPESPVCDVVCRALIRQNIEERDRRQLCDCSNPSSMVGCSITELKLSCLAITLLKKR